jgi:hypothetical protein
MKKERKKQACLSSAIFPVEKNQGSENGAVFKNVFAHYAHYLREKKIVTKKIN